MVARSFRFACYGLVATALIVLLAAGLIALRLSQGPMPLPFLTPILEREIADAAPGLTARIGATVLSWDHAARGIDLRLSDTDLALPDRGLKIEVPQVGIHFSWQPLHQRRPKLRAIVLHQLHLTLHQDPHGNLELVPAGRELAREQTVAALIAQALGSPADPRVVTLEEVDFADADVVIVDADGNPVVRLHLPLVRLSRIPSGLSFQARVLVDGPPWGVGAMAVGGSYDQDRGRVALRLNLTDLTPASLARLTAEAAELDLLRLPLSGTVDLALSAEGRVEVAHFAVEGQPGHLALSPALAARWGLEAAAQQLPVQHAVVAGAYDGETATLRLDDLRLDFGENATVHLPMPTDHAVPISSLGATAIIADDTIEIEIRNLDLAGPTATARLIAAATDDHWQGTLAAAVADVGFDTLGHYWPPALASGAHRWTTEHLSGGRASANLDAALSMGPDGLSITRLDGTIQAAEVRVDYLPPLPPVTDAAASARFGTDHLTITIDHGSALGLTITSGTIRFADFDQEVSTIDLDLTVSGPIRDALDLIGREPLGLTDRLGIDPVHARGTADARIRLAFPLVNDLLMEQIDVHADARLSDAGLDAVIEGVAMTDGNLDLRVDGAGMDLNGVVRLNQIPGRLDHREAFDLRANVQRQIVFETDAFPVARLVEAVGMAIGGPSPLAAYLVGGEIAGSVSLTTPWKGPETLVINADFTGAEAHVPLINWSKPVGGPGRLEIAATLDDGQLVAIPRFTFDTIEFTAAGAIGFNWQARVNRLDLTRLVHGRTDVAATANRLTDDSWDVTLAGRRLDLAPLLEARGDDASELPARLAIAAKVEQVWVGGDRALEGVSATAVREDDRWTLLRLDATVADGRPIRAALWPEPPASRQFRASSEDAGATLRALGIYSDMRGGQLDLDGRFDDADPDRPFAGRMRVRDYTVVNAPLLARLLNVLALAGIADLLRGDGISFSVLEGSFDWRHGTLRIRDAKAHGNALGLTGTGAVDFGDQVTTIDLRGTIVPFYVINSLLGHLPLVGQLFTGGEEGGGVFAATYALTGPLDDPKVSVNPLSLLGPGVLRHVFSIFDLSPPKTRPGEVPAE